MIESTITYKHPLRTQERLEWYRVYSFLKNVGQGAKEIGLKPEDMIHIGGTAMFFYCYEAFGSRAVAHFRGTHDLDVLSFREGAIEDVARWMEKTPGVPVSGYKTLRSPSLYHKKSFEIDLDLGNDPDLDTKFEIDVFEPNSKGIPFNDRYLCAKQIIFDQPEELDLPEYFGRVVVPSLRDALIIKADIVNFSKSGLRPKDMFDVLVMARICDTLSRKIVRFEDLVIALVEDTKRRDCLLNERKDLSCGQINFARQKLTASLLDKLDGLETAFSLPPCVISGLPKDYPLLPTRRRIYEISDAIRQIKKLYC